MGGGGGGGSWGEGFKFGKGKLSSVVNTTNHIEIKPRWGVVGGGGAATRRLITEIKKQAITVLSQIRHAFIGFY